MYSIAVFTCDSFLSTDPQHPDDMCPLSCSAYPVFHILSMLIRPARMDTTVYVSQEGNMHKPVRKEGWLVSEHFRSHAAQVLQSLNIGQLQRLADTLAEESFEDGHHIIRQGDVGNEFFIINRGNVRRLVMPVWFQHMKRCSQRHQDCQTLSKPSFCKEGRESLACQWLVCFSPVFVKGLT